jgi:hypothetical protein
MHDEGVARELPCEVCSAEGFVVEKISSAGFCFAKEKGEVVGVKFLDLCLEGKYEMICYAMYLRRQSVYLIIGFDG